MKIIRNGILVTPEGMEKGDLAFEGSVIKTVGCIDAGPDDELVDAEGCFVMPGFIDGHTHLDMDAGDNHTADDFESGTRAAVCGGTTTIVDFATQDKGGSLADALETWKKKAEGVSSCNYAFHMAVCDWNDDVRKELTDMVEEGVTSFKVYMAYDALRLNDDEILDILTELESLGAVAGCHCENGDLVKSLQQKLIDEGVTGPEGHPLSRPPQVEAEAVSRFAYLAELAGAPIYIVHLSTEEGLEEVRRAAERGVDICVETCPQYLLLDDSCYAKPDFEGAKYVMSPPLRKKSDIKALREAAMKGEIISIATDHCSFDFEGQKKKGISDFRDIPNGSAGIEHRPALMFTLFGEGKADMICRLLSEGPARLLGMYPRKGVLAEGADADIVIWDPEAEWTISASDQQQNVDHTPYEGMKMKGIARKVFVGGELAAENGRPTGVKAGRYVRRKIESSEAR